MKRFPRLAYFPKAGLVILSAAGVGLAALALVAPVSRPRLVQAQTLPPQVDFKPIKISVPFSQKSLPTVIVSPDGRHVMYATVVGKKQRVGVDGVDQREFDSIGAVTFSPNSRRTAYIATAAGETFVVVDGTPAPPLAGVKLITDGRGGIKSTIGFTPDSQRVYYGSEDALGNGKWVIDGKLFDASYVPVFSPNGRRFALCRCGAYRSQAVNVDGEESVVNGLVIEGQLVFSPDSKHLAFMTIRSDGVFVNIDGNESPAKGNIQALAYPHRTVRNKQLGEVTIYEPSPFGGADRVAMAFSHDGTRLAYRGFVDKNRLVMVVGDKVSGQYRSLGQPVFSIDGQRFAYGASNGKGRVVIDDVEHEVPDTEVYFDASRLTITEDGKRYAYKAPTNAKGNSWKVVVDGVEGRKFDIVHKPVFSPGGKHIAYVAGKLGEMVVVVDEVPSASYDLVVQELGNIWETTSGAAVFFDSDSTLHYVVIRSLDKNNIEISLVNHTLGKDR